MTGVRFDDIHHHADGGGFTGAVGSDETENFALIDIKGDVINGGAAAVGFKYMIYFNLKHRSLTFYEINNNYNTEE